MNKQTENPDKYQMTDADRRLLHIYETLQDALDAGYTCVNLRTDLDVSGYPYYGYDYRNPEGNETVGVYLRTVRNRRGSLGAVLPMYPPQS